MSKSKTYEALLVITTAFLAIYLFGLLKNGDSKSVYLYISLGTGLSGIIVRPLGTMISKGWYWLADALGWIMSKVLMLIVFVVVLIPMAMLYRIFKKDRLALKRFTGSTWITRNQKYAPENLKNIW